MEQASVVSAGQEDVSRDDLCLGHQGGGRWEEREGEGGGREGEISDGLDTSWCSWKWLCFT